MSYQKVKKLIIVLVQGVIIAGVVIFSVCPLSCKLTPEGIKIIGGDYVSPKLENCKVVDEKHIELDFSENVKLSSVSITEKDSFGIEDIENNDKSLLCNLESKIVSVPESEKIIVELTNNTEIGKNYIICGVVEDKIGNTLTFAAPFKGYNSRVPRLIITEIQPENSDHKDEDKYRNEYIKFIATENGNLFGLVTGCGNYGEKMEYNFPALEVSAGDVIVVHFMNRGSGCLDEFDNDINISTAPGSFYDGRDFWLNNTKGILQDERDVIYLKDIINNKIIDGCMYASKLGKEKGWSEKSIPYLKQLLDSGCIDSINIEDALDTTSVTPTCPLKRKDEDKIRMNIINGISINFPLNNSPDEWGSISSKKQLDRIY